MSPVTGQAPLRVCHLLGELRPSGAERMLVTAAGVFARRGCEGDVLALAEHEGGYAGVLRAAGFGVVHGPVRRRADILRHVRRHVRRTGCDVLHQHGERMSFWVAVLARAQGVRVVRTVHSCFAYTGRLRVYRTVQRALARRLGVRYVAVSASVAEVEHRVLRNPCTVVENWIDVETFSPVTAAERGAAREALAVQGRAVAAVVGNCSPVKNHPFLIDALADLPGPDRERITLLHAGAGAGEEEAKRAADRGLDVRFLPPDTDVARVLAAADVYVMPSLVEGVGLALLEALARGLPAVVADRPGLRGYGSLAGVDVVALEPAPFAAAVLAACGSYGRAELLARAEQIRRRYTAERGVGRYVELYRGGGDGR